MSSGWTGPSLSADHLATRQGVDYSFLTGPVQIPANGYFQISFTCAAPVPKVCEVHLRRFGNTSTTQLYFTNYRSTAPLSGTITTIYGGNKFIGMPAAASYLSYNTSMTLGLTGSASKPDAVYAGTDTSITEYLIVPSGASFGFVVTGNGGTLANAVNGISFALVESEIAL